MSGIIRRTMFYEKGRDGEFRFNDWCHVTTGIGAMVEPAQPINGRKSPATPFGTYDPTDQMVRVDELQAFPSGQCVVGEQVTWGTVLPKTGA